MSSDMMSRMLGRLLSAAAQHKPESRTRMNRFKVFIRRRRDYTAKDKHQTSNSKHQRSSKLQTPKLAVVIRFEVWSLELGAWSLKFDFVSFGPCSNPPTCLTSRKPNTPPSSTAAITPGRR